MIDISGLNRADVLRVLYDDAQTQGMGILHFTPEPMTTEEAAALLDQKGCGYFDYVKGRVMKIRLGGDDTFNECLYDRDNGPGAAARAIQTLR